MSLRDTLVQLGFVMIATGAALAVLALFPRIGPWRPPPIAEEEPPEKVIEAKAARKAARPRKKAVSSSRKAAR